VFLFGVLVGVVIGSFLFKFNSSLLANKVVVLSAVSVTAVPD
jgi:hypothetical protein